MYTYTVYVYVHIGATRSLPRSPAHAVTSSCQQPGTKSDRRPADKPRIKRLFTAYVCSLSVWLGFRFVRASEESSWTVVYGSVEWPCPEAGTDVYIYIYIYTHTHICY